MTTVAIVTYNSSDVIERCLDALKGTPVVVADSASSDDTLDRVRRYENVQVIPLHRNRGFGFAANVAIRAATGDVLLLNPDIVPDSRGISMLEETLHRYPQAGLVAPQLLYPDGRVQPSARTFPTPLTMLLRRTPLGKTRVGAAHLSRHLHPVTARSHAVTVDWVLGAAMFVRRQAYHDIGGFDESFFLYGEDVDLCYRMWAGGWEVRVLSEVTFVHDYQRQSARTLDLRNRATRAHWMSVLRLFAKHPGLLVGKKPAPPKN